VSENSLPSPLRSNNAASTRWRERLLPTPPPTTSIRLPASAFRALPGSDAVAEVNGSVVHIGSPQSFRERVPEADRFEDQVSNLQSAGKTVLVIGSESAAWGIIAVRDQVRPNARAAVIAQTRTADLCYAISSQKRN